jgi:Protein of unknown function (DUF1552)
MKSNLILPLTSRRRLFQNAALLAFVSPMLRRLDAVAASPMAPRRVVFLFSPNGPITQAGPASGTQTNFTLHDWWSPLEPVKADGIFMSHMACTGAGTVAAGGGHELGGQVFSGAGAGFGGDQYRQNGTTIDQLIGKRLVAEQRAGLVKSVVWGNSGDTGTGNAFALGNGQNIAPEVDPVRAFNQMFGKFTTPGQTPDAVRKAKLLARDKSVLDFLNKDCVALKNGLGTEGMALLDEHCTTLRSIEMNLGANLPTTQACTKPNAPSGLPGTIEEGIDAQSTAFTNLIASSFLCELTHVVAYQFGSQSARNRLASSYMVPSSSQVDSGDSGPAHHPWTHQSNTADKERALKIFTQFYSSKVAQLVSKLKTTIDSSGKPLLDSTLVVWISELGGDGNRDAHTTGSLPVMVFGGGQGGFKTGRYLKGTSADGGTGYKNAGSDTAKVLVAAMQYMGLSDVKTIGTCNVNGPLTSLFG